MDPLPPALLPCRRHKSHQPQFMAVLWTDPMGLKMIYAALVMMVVGALWMRKIIRIRV